MRPIPFLVSLAKPCVSPGRAATSSEYVYDHALDMVRWTGEPTFPLAIKRSGETGPTTKKSDIEKGEDNKDRRMWR